MSDRLDPRASYIPVNVRPKMRGEIQQVDRNTGEPVWSVQALHTPGNSDEPKLIRVSVTSPTAPAVSPQATGFDNLHVDHYQIKNEHGQITHSGLYYFADGVK